MLDENKPPDIHHVPSGLGLIPLVGVVLQESGLVLIPLVGAGILGGVGVSELAAGPVTNELPPIPTFF